MTYDEQLKDYVAKAIKFDGEASKILKELRDMEADVISKKKAMKTLEEAAQESLNRAWALMQEQGVTEETVEGQGAKYKIHQTKPRGSVKVADVDALPDEFVRVKKEADKKKISDFLKGLPPEKMPNWATIEHGAPKVTYSVLKK